MRACWLKWVGRDWSISADYIWLNYSDANSGVEKDDYSVNETPFSKHRKRDQYLTIMSPQ